MQAHSKTAGDSFVINGEGGRRYEVSVTLPVTYRSRPETRYPVLYVLDANLMFGSVCDSVRIASLASPLLVIATDKDDVVPTAQSEHLYNAAASPKRLVIIEGAGHNDEEILAGPRVIAAIVEFLNGISQRSPQSTQSPQG